MTDTSSAIATFNDQAAGYESQRRRLVPPFDEFYGTAVSALDLAGRPLREILDLGAGTGLLSRRVKAAQPQARLTLLDGAPAMLAEARRALGGDAQYLQADLIDPLAPGPWDAVVSALAIHHLDDDGKRRLFAGIHAELAPGGIFVNAEQVAGPSALFHDVYVAWHAREAERAGVTPDEWTASQERMRLDRWASVEHQLTWLREAGFPDVDCLYKHHCFAVLVARRAG
ncbi:MAG: class I SAM-dependent methyltransferase [Actinomycetota bacterium]|nr:class I SAM-dependent methyltransferase [Actinomycetota bacterium]